MREYKYFPYASKELCEIDAKRYVDKNIRNGIPANTIRSRCTIYRVTVTF